MMGRQARLNDAQRITIIAQYTEEITRPLNQVFTRAHYIFSVFLLAMRRKYIILV